MFLNYKSMSDAELTLRLGAIISRLAMFSRGQVHGEQMYKQALSLRNELELEINDRMQEQLSDEWDTKTLEIGHTAIAGNPFDADQIKRDRFGRDQNKIFKRRPLHDDNTQDDE